MGLTIVPSPRTESYRVFCLPLSLKTGIPVDFALRWIEKESGGNPCAVGRIGVNGPDGFPQEQGLAQFYNPDDMKRFGIKAGQFRSYCKPGTQSCSRVLTPQEIADQIAALYKLIQFSQGTAGDALRKNGAQWTASDMFKLTKLVHGLPGLVKTGVTAVTRALKRPPQSWYEYKTAILDGVKLDSGTERYRAQFARTFANAESTTGVIPDDVKAWV